MKRLLLLTASLALALTGSAAPRELVIGLVAKSQGNPVFQAARVGAEDAAKELSAKHKMNIRIDWRTPNEEDAQKQAEAIEQLVLAGAEGIAVSCSDANKLTDAINRAVDNGVPVATFDSDAPASKRFVTYGVDDIDCGRQTMEELAKVMGGKGIIAVLAGNQNAPNLQQRVQGVREVAAKFPGITIRDVYYHKETPQDAAAKVEQVMQANPDITGWAMIGGWPLFTENALKWQPGTVQCVSVDALPAQLAYIRSGHVPVLLAQQCYAWGHRSVELLIEKIVEKKNPPAVKEVSALIPVTKDTVDEFAKNWTKWLPN
ncbi:D-ribose-binding periplasmic protein precursor [Lacunisphaera limnophila]|uniref:D-ribose-binding periplasmic protein n=1 Tax=Lacunisphaera limnophila TaxID=1838286 RepID=A0A1D8ARM0_9BACT|nr:substrate-binding domain-containing protein [Lacunisphaera limnophila]AOS43548.1 D-ribose-binding periplasmic protein precursor [Lacunisphaera limnophila]